jgi:hypothetical protein
MGSILGYNPWRSAFNREKHRRLVRLDNKVPVVRLRFLCPFLKMTHMQPSAVDHYWKIERHIG